MIMQITVIVHGGFKRMIQPRHGSLFAGAYGDGGATNEILGPALGAGHEVFQGDNLIDQKGLYKAEDFHKDPQLAHRKHYRILDHEKIGLHSYDSPPLPPLKVPSRTG